MSEKQGKKEKKQKKSKTEKKKREKEEINKDKDITLKFNRIDALIKVDELKSLAQNYKAQGNFEGAINTAEKIMTFAIQFNMSALIKEQEKFINSMAEKVQHDYLTSKINDVASVIKNQYEKLINSNERIQAHALIEGFKKNYDEISYFESIPTVEELVLEDKKNWLKYQVLTQETDFQKQFSNEEEEMTQIIASLDKYYEEIISYGQFENAHDLINEFLKKYENIPIVMKIPAVQNLLLRDKKNWESYLNSKK